MRNTSILITKNDIPFPEARISIHNPEIQEIFLIGEDIFHPACQFLNFSKDNLSTEDKTVLEQQTDFDIFMSIICSKEGRNYKNQTFLILSLLFPNCSFELCGEGIKIIKDDFTTFINNNNFNVFKDIITSMFGLKDAAESGGKYNPADAAARRIAEKFNKRKVNKQENSKINIYERYISILSVGECKDMNVLLKYTVYQLKDEFKRFQLKQNFDAYTSLKLAGAQDLDEVDNWMDDIHS